MQSEAELQGFFSSSYCPRAKNGGEASAVLRPLAQKWRYVKIAPDRRLENRKFPIRASSSPLPSNPDSPSPPTPTGDRASPTPSAPASRATPWRLVFPSTACIPHLRPGPQTSVSFAFLRCARRQAGDLRSPVVGSLPEGNPLFTRPSCSSGCPSRKEAGADGFPISLPQQQIPLFAR